MSTGARRPLGLVTIGQAPRVDLLPDVRPVLGGFPYVEHGALDDLTPHTLEQVAPGPDETPLASRMRDGSLARISPSRLLPLLARAVERCVDDGAGAVLILCTGHLGEVVAPVPVLHAEPLAQAGVRAIIGEESLGIVNPLPDQCQEAAGRWSQVLGRAVLGCAANPYTQGPDEVAAAACELREQGARWVFLDCIGYTEQMRRAAVEASGLPVLLARSIAVRLAVEAATARGTGEA
ncbi:MAG: AroM family protein [Actinomyces sp.]|nr:AroM family protein [Actinomyces sp.]